MSCFSVGLGVREACMPTEDEVAMVFKVRNGEVVAWTVVSVMGLS